jgi:hypothetical protein
MKTNYDFSLFSRTGLCCLALVISSMLWAQTKDELAVVRAVDHMKQAMISGNREALEQVPAKMLSYGHSSGAIDDRQQFIEKIASGQSDFVSIDLKDQWVSVSGKTAIVRHELHATTNDNNKAGEVHLRVMLVFQKEGKNWKLLARQAVRMN